MEFGLILEEGELRVYGAGILSSPDETLFSLYSDSPHRIKMVPERVMRTDYVISDFQETYFVVDSIKRCMRAPPVAISRRSTRSCPRASPTPPPQRSTPM